MRLSSLAALLCLAVPLRADAQRSGLLLGLHADSANSYRTLWIAPVGGRIAVAATQRGIVVPRDSGFWRVEVGHACFVQWREDLYGAADSAGTHDSVSFLMEQDQLVKAPLAAPLTDVRSDCAGAWKDAGHDEPPDEGSLCFADQLRIAHASPRLVSVRGYSFTTEFCEPARYAYSRHDVVADWSDSTVSLLGHMTPGAARALEGRFEREKGECALQDGPDEAWYIERVMGGWQAAFETSGAIACRGDSEGEVTATVPLPRSLARRDDAASWFLQLRRAHGSVSDVFTSPARDLVAAIVGTRLVVHAPKGATLGPVVLTVPLLADETPVLAEWALGAHVDRWTRELSGNR